jgi:hypothetical protein
MIIYFFTSFCLGFQGWFGFDVYLGVLSLLANPVYILIGLFEVVTVYNGSSVVHMFTINPFNISCVDLTHIVSFTEPTQNTQIRQK